MKIIMFLKHWHCLYAPSKHQSTFFYLFWLKNNIKVSTIIIVCVDFPRDGMNDWTWEP